jgi:glycosyltransferase involved in cell wall biosynthesis
MDTNSNIISVLGFPAFSNRNSNPYNSEFYAALQKHNIHVDEFSFRRAFFGHYDIIHIHWPEKFLNSHYRSKALLWSVALLACLRLQRLRGRQVVWTVHNLAAHETKYKTISRLFWKHFLPNVTATISLSHANQKILQKTTALPNCTNQSVIYHPLYPKTSYNPGNIKLKIPAPYALFFGRILPYKNVEKLIGIFKTNPPHKLHLVIAGSCEDSSYQQQIHALTANSTNITLINRHISDDELHYLLDKCIFGILPFKNIFNSGSILQFPSHAKPVIAPASENFYEYSRLFRKSPFILYDDELSASKIESLIADLPQLDTSAPLQLSYKQAAISAAAFFQTILPPQ